MSIFSKIGRSMNSLPGMGTMTKPISSLMQKTPGMRGAPQALGMMPKQGPPQGIGPSPQMGQVAGQVMSQAPQEMGGDSMPDVGQAMYGQGPPQGWTPPTNVSPMPPVPMGNRIGSQNFGGANQGQMGGFAGAMGQAVGNRFGNMQKPMQGQPMNKMGRAGGFKPQY